MNTKELAIKYLDSNYHSHYKHNRYDKIQSSSDGYNISRFNKYGKRSLEYFNNDGSHSVSSSGIHKIFWWEDKHRRLLAVVEYGMQNKLISLVTFSRSKNKYDRTAIQRTYNSQNKLIEEKNLSY